jgi:hypothetical protein
MIRWTHAKKRIDAHEAYYWMDKEEEILWAQDKICFQHLVPNEMKRSNNMDNWIAGMVGTEIEVARTIEAWMQRRGGIETETSKGKEDYTRHIGTLHWKECTLQRERTLDMGHMTRTKINKNEHEKNTRAKSSRTKRSTGNTVGHIGTEELR